MASHRRLIKNPLPSKLNKPLKLNTIAIVLLIIVVVIVAVSVWKLGVKSGLLFSGFFLLSGVWAYWDSQRDTKGWGKKGNE